MAEYDHDEVLRTEAIRRIAVALEGIESVLENIARMIEKYLAWLQENDGEAPEVTVTEDGLKVGDVLYDHHAVGPHKLGSVDAPEFGRVVEVLSDDEVLLELADGGTRVRWPRKIPDAIELEIEEPAAPGHLAPDAPFQTCDLCRRKTWNEAEFDGECGMVLPGGHVCLGRFG